MWQAATRNFEGQGRFREIRALINISSEIQGKKAPQGKILEFFLVDTPKTTF